MTVAVSTKTTTTTAVVVESSTIALDGTAIVELITSLNNTRDALKALEAQEKEARSAIFALLGDAEQATVDGVVVIRAVEQTRSGIDSKLLKETYPEIAEQVATTTSYKTLRVK